VTGVQKEGEIEVGRSVSVAGLMLAAGQSSRVVGGYHKLLAEFDGVPLVRKSALTLLEAGLAPVAVVTGHRSPEIVRALHNLRVTPLFNNSFRSGMGTSIACGFSNGVLEESDAVVVMLADMPMITVEHIRRLLAVFSDRECNSVVRGAHGDQPGHPVVVPKALFSSLARLSHEEGARRVIQGHANVELVDIGIAATSDVDTREDISRAGGIFTK